MTKTWMKCALVCGVLLALIVRWRGRRRRVAQATDAELASCCRRALQWRRNILRRRCGLRRES